MAICSGCSSSGGCQCFVTAGTNMTITGTGVGGDPWVFNAAGGGGSCAQKNVYTVATVTNLFGFDLGTPEPFRSCADFLGDGVNDAVAIQAAIDASFNVPLGIILSPEVYILPGVFLTTSSIDTKAVPMRGAKNSVITSQTPGIRVVDNTVSGSGVIFSGLSFTSTSAAAVYLPGPNIDETRATDCTFSAIGAGADTAAFYKPFGNLVIDRCTFNLQDVGAWDCLQFGGNSNQILNNQFFGAGIFVDGTHQVDRTAIQGNILEDTTLTTNDYIIKINANTFRCKVQGNTLTSIGDHHGIVLENTAQFHLVTGNLIDGHGTAGNTKDGILLRGVNCNRNTIQMNKIRGSAAVSRYGINISVATCNDNMVTNNDLLNGGATASLNDAGTATVLAAGNRL